MKNTITPEGNSALKKMLSNTSLENAQLDMMKGFIDLMTGAPVFESMESMAKTIKQQKEEIERLKNETRKIKVGDFELALNSCGDTFINGKHRSLADVSKKLRELYFRTEEEKPAHEVETCDNCGRIVRFNNGKFQYCKKYHHGKCGASEDGSSQWVPF